MARRDRRYGREIFNKFFLRDNYMSREAFEAAVQDQLEYLGKNWCWCWINKTRKGLVKVFRNKHGARVVAYEAKCN